VDPQRRDRVRDDLKGFFKGELLFDDVTRALYSTDASIFQVEPAGVVVPRDEEDVTGLVRYCFENQVPLIARGAGTGVAGEALGQGLVVDLSKEFRDIVEVGPDWVRVQPGVTLRGLNTRLAAEGRRFGPDTASAVVCTIGGMLATNASGSHALRHGYTRDHVRALRVVLDNGDAVDVARHSWPLAADQAPSHLTDILAILGVLLEENRELIRSHQPRTRFNRLGYALDGVLDDGRLDVPHLLVGSEGTLGMFTEATLRTIPLPAGKAVVLLGFTSLDRALLALPKVVAENPAACELLDRRLLSLARGHEATEVSSLIAPAAEFVLLIEFEDESPVSAQRSADRLVHLLTRAERTALYGIAVHAEAEQRRLWRLRESALPGLYGIRGGPQPVLGVEDVGVPLDVLAEYLRRVQEILHEHETTASFLIHAGAGQVHTRPFLDLRQPDQVARLTAIAAKVHELAIGLGGTVSTQHGTGLARTQWVARQAGKLYPLMRQVKAIFDPRNLFNPGKIVDPDPQLPAWPIRKFAASEPVSSELRWQPLEVVTETNRCNGCGTCRSDEPTGRMCPTFRASHAEMATPRAQMNNLRWILREGGDPRALGGDELREVADLCINCKMCKNECPAHIDIPKLMLEVKAANVVQHGLSRDDWFMAHLEDVARLGTLAPIVGNGILRSRSLRWLLDRVFGLSRKRRLPTFTRKPFLKIAHQRGWTRLPPPSRPRVVLFSDLYVNYFDPQIGEAAGLVLWHNGFDVFVPPDQVSSGIEALANGDVERTRDRAQRNLRILADLAREGVPIVCIEPSSVLMFRNDYLDVLDDLDARLVASRTVEFTAFLHEMHRQGKLRTDFQPLDLAVGHHVPCHQKVVQPIAPGPELLRAIPGIRVETIDRSCSGMAGTFGLKRRNQDLSRRAGAPMIDALRAGQYTSGSTECNMCRIQMEDVGRTRTLHPAQYLAWAYGLLPEVAQRLKEPMRDLVLR
jgi:FAD/FMN-containing dehydrogenase/Fe-S oxidoreductase